jgi:hypothetical protein
MASEWYFQKFGSEVGPITTDELRLKAAKGIIAAETLIRRGGNGEWVAAKRFNGLKFARQGEVAKAQRLPDQDISLATVCPRCDMAIAYQSLSSGRTVKCPKCATPVLLGQLESPRFEERSRPAPPQAFKVFGDQTRPCKYCGHVVARNAKRCQGCNGEYPFPTGPEARAFAIALLAAIVVGALITAMGRLF